MHHDLSALPNLQVINMAGNQLQGTLPHSLFQDLKELQHIDLKDNQLTGTIPIRFIITAASTSMKNLALSNNRLTGTISPALGVFQEGIALDHNLLTGSIPTQLFGDNLQSLLLTDNQVSIVVPSTGTNLCCLLL